MCRVFSEVTFYRGSDGFGSFSVNDVSLKIQRRGWRRAMEMVNFQQDPKIGGAVGADSGDGNFRVKANRRGLSRTGRWEQSERISRAIFLIKLSDLNTAICFDTEPDHAQWMIDKGELDLTEHLTDLSAR